MNYEPAFFDEDVVKLRIWLIAGEKTDGEFLFWVIKYLAFHGVMQMLHAGKMSMGMAVVASDFDWIGWVDVMNGRVPTSLPMLQETHCAFWGCRTYAHS